jgi:hypothetical protein
MQIKVGGIDKTSLYQPGSLNISDEISGRSTAGFQLVDKTGTYHTSPGQAIEIYDNALNLIFGGMVEDPEEENPLGTNVLFLPVQCVDQQALADRWLVIETYDNQTCGFMVRDFITKYLAQEGVVAGTVQDGPTVSRAVFPYISVSKALDDLAEQAGFSWWISADKKLNFVSRDTFRAPWNVTDTSPIRAVKVRTNKDQYRNRQYIRAGRDVTDPQQESFAGDGKRQTFVVGFGIAKVPTVTLNGVAQTVGIRGLDQGKQWYWSKSEKEITQEQSGIAITSADTLVVDYRGYFPILVVADSGSAISERKSVEGGTGIYESIDDQASIDSATAALDIANGKLRKYARLSKELTFETDKAGLKAGQIINVTQSIHNINTAEFLVDKVSISEYKPDGSLRYQVHAVDGEALGGWTNFFKALANQGGNVSIRENEVLVKLKSAADTVGARDILTISKGAPETRIGYAMIGFAEVG